MREPERMDAEGATEKGNGATALERFAAMPGWRRWGLWLCFLVVLIGSTVVAGELIMRFKGRRPWRAPVMEGLKVVPGGKMYQLRENVGFGHVPGALEVTFPNGYAFGITNDDQGLRVTGPPYALEDDVRPGIWVFGCSFTYGWGLNDNETYPWLLQARLPGYDVVNFGQCAYGTVQSLLQLQEALQDKPAPRVAVLAYASFHDERNALLRRWRRSMHFFNSLGPLRQPYARLDGRGALQIRYSPSQHDGFPLTRHSALAFSLEEKYALLMEQYFIQSHEVSKALIKEFSDTCAEQGIRFVVAGIDVADGTSEMLAYCRSRGIACVDIAVDYVGNSVYNNEPHDPYHPGPKANAVYAERLEAYLAGENML